MMTESFQLPSECFGEDCHASPVYIAERIILYPVGQEPVEGTPNTPIVVCMRHKNDEDIDGALIMASKQATKRKLPNVEWTRDKGEVYWRML